MSTEGVTPAAEDVGTGIPSRRGAASAVDSESQERARLEKEETDLRERYGDEWGVKQTLAQQYSKPGYFKMGDVLVEYFDLSVVDQLKLYNERVNAYCDIDGKKSRLKVQERVDWSSHQASHKVMLVTQLIMYRQLRVNGQTMKSLAES